MTPLPVIGWFEQLEQRLHDFSSNITVCINAEDWEILSTVLESRQIYLEEVFSKPIPEKHRDAVRVLIESTLEEDEVFQAKIQELKHLSEQQHLVLGRGLRAVQAYNS